MSDVQAFEIPITPATAQKMSVTLGGVAYDLQLRWNDASQCWILDIFDTADNSVLRGLPLVTGCDLLGQFAYLDFSGMLVVQTDSDAFAVPTFSSIGDTGHLYFVVQQ